MNGWMSDDYYTGFVRPAVMSLVSDSFRPLWKVSDLPGKFHGQRNLEGHSPRGCKELDTTECARAHTHIQIGRAHV